jgi:Cysteine rich repeat
MGSIRSILVILVISVPSLAAADTVSFEQAAALLGASCGKDIDDNCRGVNLDPTRLKECLARNQDVVSPLCKVDSAKAFDAIQKRIVARAAAAKACERDAAKYCAGTPKENGKLLQCLLTLTRGLSVACTRAIGEAGYR